MYALVMLMVRDPGVVHTTQEEIETLEKAIGFLDMDWAVVKRWWIN